MTKWYTRLAFLFSAVGLAATNLRNQSEANSSEDIPSVETSSSSSNQVRFERRVPVEIVENGEIRQTFVDVKETFEQKDHLAESNYIRDEILNCLERKTESANARVFYTAKESYLRGKQVDVVRNPGVIKDIKENITKAESWYGTYKDSAATDFKMAFASSDLEVAEHTRRR